MSNPRRTRSASKAVPLSLLASSVFFLTTAPMVIPDSYSLASNTLSEAAAQQMPGSWAARLGFLTFGLAVVVAAAAGAPRWSRLAVASHGLFGALMCSAAAFSNRPWRAPAPYDVTEDMLHSMAASGMGAAFVVGVAATALSRRGQRIRLMLDTVAIASSLAIPVAMFSFPSIDGLLQRAMFVVAYGWYFLEIAKPLPRGVSVTH